MDLWHRHSGFTNMSQMIADGAEDESANENRPRRRRSRLVWVVLVGIAACLTITSLAVWKFATRPRSRLGGNPIGERTMPDGTVLVLEQVTVKKPHEFAFDQQKGSMVSSFFKGLRGGSSAPQSKFGPLVDDNASVVWFTRWHPTLPDSLDFDWWLTSVLVDEHGEEIEDGNEQSLVFSASGSLSSKGSARPWPPLARAPGDVIVAISRFPAVRQAAGSRKVKVYNRDGAQVAEFDVLLPDTSQTPRWSPDPLPTTKTADDVRVTFTQVSFKERPTDAKSPVKLAHRRPRWSVVPTFTVERDGRPAPEWKAEAIRLTDALGNASLDWNCRLSTYEPAWKLELTLARDAPQAFTLEEQWESPLVSLPAVDSSQPAEHHAKVQGVDVSLVSVGHGATQYVDLCTSASGASHRIMGTGRIGKRTYGVSHSTSWRNKGPARDSVSISGSCAHLLVKLEHLPPNHRELFRVYDDLGRELPHQVDTLTTGDTLYAFVFVDPATDAQDVRVTVFVHTARTVELLLAPAAREDKVERRK